MSTLPTTPADGIRWTDSQRAAIAHPGGDLLVSAAAGSGKTAVLAERCAQLVCGGGAGERCGVENLLVLTFTDAAAGEMRSRIARAIRAKMHAGTTGTAEERRWLRRQAAMVDRASISTLHAFCARVLRQHFHEAGIDPAFEVMDGDEATLMQDEVLDELLARWHGLAPGAASGGVTAEAFAGFLETYAQGRDSNCAFQIQLLHRMLASTADPAQYVAMARETCAGGAADILTRYSSENLMNHLRLARMTVQRGLDEVRPLLGSEKMRTGLEQAIVALDESAEVLRTLGHAGWETISSLLKLKWPALRGEEKLSDFVGLRERVWDETKKLLNKLAQLFKWDGPALLRELQNLAPSLDALLAMTAAFEEAYTAAKRAENRLDFADLERLALTLLRPETSHAAADLRRRYHHVLVDEFQDINPLQAALLQAVRSGTRFGGRGNLFVVGDVKQSIYGFRLAEPNLFIEREKAARAGDAGAYVALQENFRSRPKLLEVMNGIFERLLTGPVAGVEYAQGHALLPPGRAEAAPPPPEGTRPFDGVPVEVHLVAMDTEEEEENGSDELPPKDQVETLPPKDPAETLSAVEQEAARVAERIAAMMKENRVVRQKDGTYRPLHYGDIAILLRTMKGRAMIFARALAERGIRMHADLSAGFFDTPEVRHVMALLHVLDNPRQDIPLSTVMLGPFGRFVHDDLAAIRLAYDRKEVKFADAVLDSAAPSAELAAHRAPGEPLPEDLVARLREFLARISLWREKLRARPLHEGLAEIYAESRLLAYVSGMETGRQRVANLQLLHQRALTFASFRRQGLHRFLRFIERMREQDSGGDSGEAPVHSSAADVVRIMSVHKSKGLEFPVVFVSGLGSKLRLSESGPIFVHRDLGIGLYSADVERNFYYESLATLRIADAHRRSLRAEELRLLYVAITRARECLVLSGHIATEKKLQRWRSAWEKSAGPLPEDVLLRAQTPLDWLMPALVMPWAQGPHVAITVHAPLAGARATASPDASSDAARIMQGLPLEDASPTDPRIERLVRRVTGTYPHEEFARQSAVHTVTALKTLTTEEELAGPPLREDEVSPEELDFDEATLDLPGEAQVDDAGERSRAGELARARGIATHRVLELLDLSQCDGRRQVEAQVERLVERRILLPAEVERADWAGIHWFLDTSESGRRLIAAARRGGDFRVRRELPFTWLAPASLLKTLPAEKTSTDPADRPTIRGIIDVLVVAGNIGEILDYKTDSAALWETRLDDYRRQMRYYMAAATDILGFPVSRATLLFLSPQREIVVAAE